MTLESQSETKDLRKAAKKYPGILIGLRRVDHFKTDVKGRLNETIWRICRNLNVNPHDYLNETAVVIGGSYSKGILPGPNSDYDIFYLGSNPDIDNKVVDELENALEEMPHDLHRVGITHRNERFSFTPKPVNLGILSAIGMCFPISGSGHWVDAQREVTADDWEKISLYSILSQGDRARPDLSRNPGIKYVPGSVRTLQAITYLQMYYQKLEFNLAMVDPNPFERIQQLVDAGSITQVESRFILQGISDVALCGESSSNMVPNKIRQNWKNVFKVFEDMQRKFFREINLGADVLTVYPEMSRDRRLNFMKRSEFHAMVSAWTDEEPEVLEEVMEAYHDSWPVCLGVAVSRFSTKDQIETVLQINERSWRDEYLKRVGERNLLVGHAKI